MFLMEHCLIKKVFLAIEDFKILYDFHISAVAPGFIKTDMTNKLDEKELKKIIPAKRFGEARIIKTFR